MVHFMSEALVVKVLRIFTNLFYHLIISNHARYRRPIWSLHRISGFFRSHHGPFVSFGKTFEERPFYRFHPTGLQHLGFHRAPPCVDHSERGKRHWSPLGNSGSRQIAGGSLSGRETAFDSCRFGQISLAYPHR